MSFSFLFFSILLNSPFFSVLSGTLFPVFCLLILFSDPPSHFIDFSLVFLMKIPFPSSSLFSIPGLFLFAFPLFRFVPCSVNLCLPVSSPSPPSSCLGQFCLLLSPLLFCSHHPQIIKTLPALHFFTFSLSLLSTLSLSFLLSPPISLRVPPLSLFILASFSGINLSAASCFPSLRSAQVPIQSA